jgi:hypothetical protein
VSRFRVASVLMACCLCACQGDIVGDDESSGMAAADPESKLAENEDVELGRMESHFDPEPDPSPNQSPQLDPSSNEGPAGEAQVVDDVPTETAGSALYASNADKYFTIRPIVSSFSYKAQVRVCNTSGGTINNDVKWFLMNWSDNRGMSGSFPKPWLRGECRESEWKPFVSFGKRKSCSGSAKIHVRAYMDLWLPERSWFDLAPSYDGRVCAPCDAECHPCTWDPGCLWRSSCVAYP